MTLDEAIKHAEEVAEKNEKKAKNYPRPDKNVKGSGRMYNAYLKCAEEQRQLAEWLKDYKRLLEQEACDDNMSGSYRHKMTIEEAIYCMKSYVDDDHYEHCTSCPYYARNQIGSQTFVCESSQAHKLAIAALEYCRVKEVLLGRD